MSKAVFALVCSGLLAQSALAAQMRSRAEGVPGVVVIVWLEALNGFDFVMLQRLDRREIAAAARQHFGPEVVTRLINQFA